MSIKDLKMTDKPIDELVAEYDVLRKEPLPSRKSLKKEIEGYVKEFVDRDLKSDEFVNNNDVMIYPEKIGRNIYPNWNDVEAKDRAQVKTAIKGIIKDYVKTKGCYVPPRDEGDKKRYRYVVVKKKLDDTTQEDNGNSDPVKPAKGTKGKS